MNERDNYTEKVAYSLDIKEREYDGLTKILRQIGMMPEDLLKKEICFQSELK